MRYPVRISLTRGVGFGFASIEYVAERPENALTKLFFLFANDRKR